MRWPIGARLGVELETELERSQTTAVAMALSLVYDLPAIGRVTPYVAGGIGLAPRGVVYFGPGGLASGHRDQPERARGRRHPRAGDRALRRAQRRARASRTSNGPSSDPGPSAVPVV
ncbi:MAG: hypothetical protein ABIT71_00245 [Vicinamibacteraceae bacterium]